MKYHKNLEEKTWFMYNMPKQILSIGAELMRAKSMINISNFKESQNSLYKTIELVDMTVDDAKWNRKLKELLKFKEILAKVCLYHFDQKEYVLSLLNVLFKFHSDTYQVQY